MSESEDKNRNTEDYKMLRLQVMMSINHPEEYYKTAALSMGFDLTTMHHSDIATLRAMLDSGEADIILDTAFNTEPVPVAIMSASLDKIATHMKQRGLIPYN